MERPPRGEGVPPLRREAILASRCPRRQRISAPKCEGRMPSPRRLDDNIFQRRLEWLADKERELYCSRAPRA